MADFSMIALSGAFSGDPSLAIAASRAGAIGVLDLSLADDDQRAGESLLQMARWGRANLGVKVDASNSRFFTTVAERLPPPIGVVLVVAASRAHLQDGLRTIRRPGLRVLVEVVSVDEAELAESLGADGLVVKGNEAGGRVGGETTLVLLQRVVARTALPVWGQGGIGLHSAAGCFATGATGVVLDSQLLLARGSDLTEPVRAVLGRMDGGDTGCTEGVGESFRGYAAPGSAALARLKHDAERLRAGGVSDRLHEALGAWRASTRASIDWSEPGRGVLPVGQDAAMAAPLAARFRTVAGILDAVRSSVEAHVSTAQRLRPFDEGSPLARSHGIRYPVVQGPMTRVSDRAAFAAHVADAGALPFLALALMTGDEASALLSETKRAMGGRPWGVGILGFVPLDRRLEQLAVIREHRPSVALIAGGRPDQALSLQEAGIPTYLHVPSPALLELFLESGARRFVFEGRECGGHVGPRSSFVLWDGMIEMLLDRLTSAELTESHVLFAGGIHDAVSAASAATMAAPLAERGARVGVLLGTAYLFTEEAVASGAIVPGFQQQALRCRRTVLLETGPGHSTRCADTAFPAAFADERQRLLAEALPLDEVKDRLEELSLGRLRVAAKGVDRDARYGREPGAPKLTELTDGDQEAKGMYMIGQVAALRDSVVTMADLHRDVSSGSSERLGRLSEPAPATPASSCEPRPCDVAIVGMSCLLPKAPDLATYWQNILTKQDAITEVPRERWDWRRYFDADPRARDRVYSRWGGFMGDVRFDPTRWGIPPHAVPSIEPLQLLTLEAVGAALGDAGYAARPFPRDRTSVILGVGGGIGELGQRYVVRSELPTRLGGVSSDVLAGLPEWTEDSFPGILLNVAAGRVANRFDLGGVNYTVDAACASSLAAVHLAVRELEAGTSDMVVVGGADTVQSPFAYLCFSKTAALSPTGRCRPFDAEADGIAISEGVAILVLKRLADAERDGDRIYAVLKAVAGSSDGRGLGLTAPRPEGQVLALERSYATAGVSPSTVGLIEAHGTGTVAGDQAEVKALRRVFESAGAAPDSCAIGSVKSMIGHTKCTAGVAGMIKAALALHHGVLPPTINVTMPNAVARAGESPFYVNTEPRPWFRSVEAPPRRAGVSAFGFGGTNFHAVLEEYCDDFVGSPQAPTRDRESELFVWAADSPERLTGELDDLVGSLERGAQPALRDLAFTLWRGASPKAPVRAAVVASSLTDLREKVVTAAGRLREPGAPQGGNAGVHVGLPSLGGPGTIALVFPGQGSQYVDMLRELVLHFPELRTSFELADRVLSDRLPRPLSTYVFPPPGFSAEEAASRAAELTGTDIAQPAMGATGAALLRLLAAFGLRPDAVAGHSYGEYVALYAAGAFSEEELYAVSHARGRLIVDSSGDDLGAMAAVAEDRGRVGASLEEIEGVWIANVNAPRQTVISGTTAAVACAVEMFESEGVPVRTLPVACGFHSPVLAPAKERLDALLASVDFQRPAVDVYSNSTGGTYPTAPGGIAGLLGEQMVRPVLFVDEIEAMYRRGVRVFIEVGPRRVLSGLVGQILGPAPHAAVPLDGGGAGGLGAFHDALARLWAHGVAVDLARLFHGRAPRRLALSRLEEETVEAAPSSTTWLVNGGSARPVASPGREPTEARDPAIAPIEHAPRTDGLSPAGHRPPETAKDQPPPTPPVTPLPARTGSVDDDGVMLGFQRLMNRFLETQQQVMTAYLRGGSAAFPTPVAVDSAPLGNGSQATPVPPAAALDARVVPASSAGDAPSGGTDGPDGGEEVRTAASPPAESPRRVSSADEITRHLVQIVTDRTGYPPEMLALDADIHADLGIDSIKRVEILGTLQREVFGPGWRATAQAMEALVPIKTLRGIVQWALEAGAAAAPQGAPVVTEGVPPTGEDARVVTSSVGSESPAHTPRFVMKAVEAALPPVCRALPGAPLIITDDGQGIADILARDLRSRGAVPVLVRLASGGAQGHGDDYTADITQPDIAASLIDAVQQRYGGIAGLVHLLPLAATDNVDPLDAEAFHASVRRDLRTLFHLARSAGPALKRSVEAGGGWLLAATRMGGTFGLDDADPVPLLASQGGVAGMVKALALEWPGVDARVIDMSSGASPSETAGRLLAEMAARTTDVEVGYRNGHRFAFRAISAPLDDDARTPPPLGRDSVVLLTGGARGITAAIGRHLAERYRPTLVVVGRSAGPEIEEAPDTVGFSDATELKKALIERMRSGDEPVTPARVEEECTRVLRSRESRRNLVAMREAGATVEYRQLDVRDGRGVGALIDDLYSLHGRIDGVVHGAGVIEDCLIEDKSIDSFDRVFDTKVVSALALLRSLRGRSLRFLTFFSSTAGRFGNGGQSDYAAANEAMGKLAVQVGRGLDARVAVLHWGPWRGPGMVSDAVQRRFDAQGVPLIEPAAGVLAFDRELRSGSHTDREVVLGGGPWADRHLPDRPKLPNSEVFAPMALPLLNGTRLAVGTDGSRQAVVRLDPVQHRYLDHHRLDGTPVLPAAMAMELIVESVEGAWPDLTVQEVRDLRVLRGVVLTDDCAELRVTCRPEPGQPHRSAPSEVQVEIRGGEDGQAIHYRALVRSGSRLPGPPAFRPPSSRPSQPFPRAIDDAYDDWLFHGDLFRSISAVDEMGPWGLTATVTPSHPSQSLGSPGPGDWLVDPMVIDSAPQLAILWARAFRDMTALPTAIRRYRRFGPLAGEPLHCHFELLPDSDQAQLAADVAFTRPDGALMGLLEGLECTSSRSLNRLAGSHLRAAPRPC